MTQLFRFLATFLALSVTPLSANASLLKWCASLFTHIRPVSREVATPTRPFFRKIKWNVTDPDQREYFFFRNINLDYSYRREELGESHHFGEEKVLYLVEAERHQYRVIIQNGILLDAFGIPLTLRYDPKVNTEPPIFVMDSAGNIYATSKGEYGYFHHSTLSSGMPVSAAGQLEVQDGNLLRINYASGHYRPPAWSFQQVLRRLNRAGVDLAKVEIGDTQDYKLTLRQSR